MPPRFLTSRAVCASLALLPAVPASAGVLHSPQGYAVTIPVNWQTQHTLGPLPGYPDQMMDVVVLHPPKHLPLLKVEVEPAGGATLAQAGANTVVVMKRACPDYRMLGQRRRLLAGQPSVETMGCMRMKGVAVVTDTIFTTRGRRDYTVTLLTTPPLFHGSITSFLTILKNFRWTPPTASCRGGGQ